MGRVSFPHLHISLPFVDGIQVASRLLQASSQLALVAEQILILNAEA
jgi:hypothetical protein